MDATRAYRRLRNPNVIQPIYQLAEKSNIGSAGVGLLQDCCAGLEVRARCGGPADDGIVRGTSSGAKSRCELHCRDTSLGIEPVPIRVQATALP